MTPAAKPSIVSDVRCDMVRPIRTGIAPSVVAMAATHPPRNPHQIVSMRPSFAAVDTSLAGSASAKAHCGGGGELVSKSDQ